MFQPRERDSFFVGGGGGGEGEITLGAENFRDRKFQINNLTVVIIFIYIFFFLIK